MRIETDPEPLDPQLTPELIESICHHTFGGGGVAAAIQLGGGLYNSTYRLDLPDQSPLILRVAPAEADQRPSELHLMRNEVASIDALHPVAHLMPSTVTSDFTHRLVPRDYVIQTYLEGVPGTSVGDDWSTADSSHMWESIGRILNLIHTETSPTFGRLLGPTNTTWAENVAVTMTAMADGCDQLNLDGTDLRQLATSAAREDAAVLNEVTPAHLLHGDLGPGNVMVDPTDPSRGVTGLFDCDRTAWGDPRADVTFAYLNRLSPELKAAFWSGYGPAPITDQRRELYYLARVLGEARLQHARLHRTRQLNKTYDLMADVITDLAIQ